MRANAKPSKWLLVTGVAGFVFGLLGDETSELELDTPADGVRWGMLGFFFFLISCSAIALFERVFLGFLTRLQWIANRQTPPLRADGFSVTSEKLFGCFILSLGISLAISSAWSTAHGYWVGFPYVGGGLGLVVGAKVGRRILQISKE